MIKWEGLGMRIIGSDHQSSDNQTCKRKEETEPGEATESWSQAKAVWSQKEMD